MIGSSSVLLKTPNNFIYSRPPRKTPDCRAPRSPPYPLQIPHSVHFCPILDPPHANWWKRPQESNGLEGHQAAGVVLASPSGHSRLSVSLRLVSAPIKESLMKHGEGITTNANWQMSCIVPGYNKQYGCLSWISMRMGSAFWRLCFDCCF